MRRSPDVCRHSREYVRPPPRARRRLRDVDDSESKLVFPKAAQNAISAPANDHSLVLAAGTVSNARAYPHVAPA